MIAVKLYLRATQIEFKRHLLDMGCRQLKYFYDVYDWTPGNTSDAILALTRMSTKSRININTRKFLSTMLKGIQHPNIDMPREVAVLPDSSAVCVVRKVYRRGSLRDHIYNALYHNNFVAKYYKTTPTPFREEQIASIGKQILNALLFLESHGIPYTHLSAGNVMLTSGGVARLTETENAFLKIERFYEHIFREFAETHQAAFLLADINVLAFGCVLYEMSTALPVHRLEDLDNLALGLPELSDIIRKIFHADGKNTLVPTLKELAEEPFFASAKVPKVARVSEEDLQAQNAISWSVTENDIMKDALKANAKIIYPDNEKLYLKTVTQTNAPQKQLGGFAMIPKPSKVKKSKHGSSKGATSSRAQEASIINYNSSNTPPRNTSSPAAPAPNPPPNAGNNSRATSPPPPPPPPRTTSPSSGGNDKAALLSSIAGFKGGLKKTVTNDKSAPKL